MIFNNNKKDDQSKQELPELTWEPAKPGEKPPKEVWIPNRRERRKMKKSRNKNMRFLGNAVEQANVYARNNPEFKQDVYRALYENLKRLAEEKKEELSKKNEEEEKENKENGTNEGN